MHCMYVYECIHMYSGPYSTFVVPRLAPGRCGSCAAPALPPGAPRRLARPELGLPGPGRAAASPSRSMSTQIFVYVGMRAGK